MSDTSPGTCDWMACFLVPVHAGSCWLHARLERVSDHDE